MFDIIIQQKRIKTSKSNVKCRAYSSFSFQVFFSPHFHTPLHDKFWKKDNFVFPPKFEDLQNTFLMMGII